MASLAVADPTQYLQIPFGKAVLCQDCEIVSNTPHNYCPACGSMALLQLARVLNRENSDAAGISETAALQAKIAPFPARPGPDGADGLPHSGSDGEGVEPVSEGMLSQTQGAVRGLQEVCAAARRAD